jgi:nucleotide-binding universal stress UspA family protein
MTQPQPAPAASKIPKYMVCADNRPESRAALRLACMKARGRRGKVDIVHVVAPADFQTLGAIADRMREERIREGQELLAKLAAEAMQKFGVQAGQVLREGSIGEEIIHAATKDPEVIMLVIGIASQTAGRGSLATWLAAQLGHKLLTPILMVPGELTDEQLLSLV